MKIMGKFPEIPTQKLHEDLKATIADIDLCNLAISLGMTEYTNHKGERQDVINRLKRNKEIKILIEEELKERCEI